MHASIGIQYAGPQGEREAQRRRHYDRGRSLGLGPTHISPHCSDVGLATQVPLLAVSSRRALTQNSDPASCACMEPAVLSGSCASAQVRG